ncbi:MAG: hypothetical protein ACRD0V_03430 [Acidimicrobiales bacterium]
MPGLLLFDKLPGMFIVVLAAIVGDQRAMLDRFGAVPELRISTTTTTTTDEVVIAFTTTDGR